LTLELQKIVNEHLMMEEYPGNNDDIEMIGEILPLDMP
jgi:hypothetical protein